MNGIRIEGVGEGGRKNAVVMRNVRKNGDHVRVSVKKLATDGTEEWWTAGIHCQRQTDPGALLFSTQ